MVYPNFNEEKKLWTKGYECVVGLDESGRGPLAGPVVAAAVSLDIATSDVVKKLLRLTSQDTGIRDSKKLSEKQREFFYEILTNHKDMQWGIGVVSEKVIDKINILEATKLAMQKAVDEWYHKNNNWRNYGTKGFLLIDGNFNINSKIPQASIIKGDQKVFSISAASIIAKVTRDRIMQKMHKKYPKYGFEKHKGYGTKLHFDNLKNFGPCKIHRKSFSPISELA